MRVFLTGGTGFIGKELTRALIARGWSVVALVRRPDSADARVLASLGARCVAGDITDRESMRAAMTGVDIVVHNAAWYEIGITPAARERMHAINVTGVDHVLSLSAELHVPRIVFVSSTVYFGDTGPEMRDETFVRQAPNLSFYERTKAEAHELAMTYQRRGLPVISVCPAHVTGANDHAVWGRFLRLYLSHLMSPVAFAASTTLTPVSVTDVAEGIALAAEKGRVGESYILSGDAMSVRQLFDIWNAEPGGLRVRLYVPRWLAMPMYAPVGPALRALGVTPSCHGRS